MNFLTNHPLIINKAKPASLTKCLESMKKDQLILLAGRITPNDFDILKASKAKLISTLEECILQRAKYIFMYKPSEIFTFFCFFWVQNEDDRQKYFENLKKTFEEAFEEKDAFDVFYTKTISFLLINGLLFAFKKNEESEIEYHVPSEVGISIGESKNYNLENEFATIGKWGDFDVYAKTLTMLYGVCPLDNLLAIYNRDCSDKKINSKKELEQIVYEAASCSDDYSYNRKYDAVVDLELDYQNPDEDIDYIIKERKTFLPYIPSEDEINNIIPFTDYDEPNPSFAAVSNFFAKKTGDDILADEITSQLGKYVKRGYTLTDALSFIFEDYEISFSGEKEANKVLEDLQEFNNSLHLWIRWGHTPNELSSFSGKERAEKFYTTEAIEEETFRREHREHVDLPEDCHVPTNDEVIQLKNEYDDYWKAVPWHSIGAAQIKRFNSQTKKILAEFKEVSESIPGKLIDQWLASIWHKNADKGGLLGNQQWNYYAFELLEKIGNELFVCRTSEGKIIVVASEAIQKNVDDGATTFFTILLDVGDWYLTYGPVWGWKGFIPSDFDYIAKNVAKQTFELYGLTAVVQFNPTAFWDAIKFKEMSPIGHRGKIIQFYNMECRFKDNTPPDFEKLFPQKKFNWEKEEAQKCVRWIFNGDDYLGSYGLYFDTKEGTVLLFAHDGKRFESIHSPLKPFLEKCGPIDHPTMMAFSIARGFFNKKMLLEKFEGKF